MTFRVMFPATGGRTGIATLPCGTGKTLKTYFHEQPLRDEHLLGLRSHCKMVNQHNQKIKLNYVPKPGDTVVLQRIRSMS